MKNKTEQTPPTWKVGDWCFCEYKLQQIQDMEDGRITTVSDGFGSYGSRDLSDRCYPLTLRGNQISERYRAVRKELSEIGGSLNLNYPDICHYLVCHWCECMDRQDDDLEVKDSMTSLDGFVEAIRTAVKKAREMEVQDIKLFRP